MMVQDDTELLREIDARNLDALGLLFDRYSGMVYTLAFKMLQHSQEAEDLTQEIFLSIWERSTYQSERGTFRSYLMTKTRSRAIDRLRVRQNRRRILQQWQSSLSLGGQSSNSLDRVASAEQKEAINFALAQLSPQYREVLELGYFGGYSQSEIAAQLNRPLGTVKSWVRKALIQLRQEFHAYMEDTSHG